jgi:transposase
MARKNYTEEFRRQAVDLYRSTPGATLRGIAADLGISRHTLQVWVHALDPDPTNPSSEPSSEALSEPAERQGRRAGRPGSAAAELAALRARVAALETENAELMVEQTKLATERDILRQAAKYFAGETNW